MVADELKYAKMPSSIVHPAGLFVSFPKGTRASQKLDVTYSVGELKYQFWGPEPLDVTDLRVLQGLSARGTADVWEAKRMLRDGRALKPMLSAKGSALLDRAFAADVARTIAVRFEITSFVESLGYVRGGSMRKKVLESIARLSAVSVVIQGPDFEVSSRLVTGYVRDRKSGGMVVGLSPTLTAAVFARKNFLAVSLEEVRKLKSDVARILHWRLHFINQADAKKVSLNTLCEYVYPSSDRATPLGTLRSRQNRIRQALVELRQIGWLVFEKKPGVYTIVRPAYKRDEPWMSAAYRGRVKRHNANKAGHIANV